MKLRTYLCRQGAAAILLPSSIRTAIVMDVQTRHISVLAGHDSFFNILSHDDMSTLGTRWSALGRWVEGGAHHLDSCLLVCAFRSFGSGDQSHVAGREVRNDDLWWSARTNHGQLPCGAVRYGTVRCRAYMVQCSAVQ